jgi:alcohol dehydrogenase YqhD (iron-dependent ADH family)
MEGIAKTKALFKQIGAPIALSKIGIGTEKLDLMVKEILGSHPFGCG